MGRVSKVMTLSTEDKAWLDAELMRRGFSGYDELEALCRERGIDLSSSSLQRYGAPFQQRLERITIITEQARAVVAESPDDEGKVNEALMRLVQEKLFDLLEKAQYNVDDMTLTQITRAIADLGRASVSQKRMAAEVRAQVLAEQKEALDQLDTKGGVTDEAKRAIREALGIAQ